MLFGLPWWAIIAIVAIVGGMYTSIREKEMKLEEKRLTSSKEAQELRKMIFNLKSRVEHLETIVTDLEEKQPEITLDDIEIKNDLDDDNKNSSRVRG
jgi:chromosome segregation ATPase